MKKIILTQLPELENQIEYINKMYMNCDFHEKKLVKKNLKSKINSYKQQDKKKNILTDIISFDQLIEKLIISKLKCYYCNKNVLIIYEISRDPRQWTLDRLDNLKGHTNFNVVISCLKCNLDRRIIDDKKFLFTKKLTLKKII